MTETRLINHQFNVSQMHGNCGVQVLYRLTGNYISRDESERILKKEGPKPIPEPKSKDQYTIVDMVDLIKREHAHQHPYPIEFAYTCALSSIHGGSYALIAMSDTENGRGDGHRGAFATRNMAEWMQKEGLVDGEKTTAVRYPNTSDRREVYGWFFVPNKAAITKFLVGMRKTVYEFIVNWNSQPELREAVKKKAEQKDAMRRKLLQGWDSSGAAQPEVVVAEMEPMFVGVRTGRVVAGREHLARARATNALDDWLTETSVNILTPTPEESEED